MTETTIIGASGPSLGLVEHNRLPSDAHIIRVNNFFLESHYHLGPRVDTAYFSADPRAVRFYVATLRALVARNEYVVGSTASHLPAAARLPVPAPFEFFAPRDPAARRLLDRLAEGAHLRPTSGAMAMLYAVENGAERLILTGVDFYAGPKYGHDLPPRLHRVLRPNLSESGYDDRLHTQEADLSVVEFLIDRGIDVRLGTSRVSDVPSPIALEPAPVVMDHVLPSAKAHPYVNDWSRWAGPWSIEMLVAARWARRQLRPVRGTNRRDY